MPCSSSVAIARERKLVESGGSWSYTGDVSDIDDLLDDGYSWKDTAYQYALYQKSGATPNHYLVPIF